MRNIRQLLIIFLLFLINKEVNCQVFGNIIERTIQSTVLIKTGKGSGSGILVQDTSGVSLITAKHVIFNAEQQFSKLNSNQAWIQFYAKNFKSDIANYISLDLNKLSENSLLLVDSLNDICVLKLAKIEESGAIKYYSGISRLGYGVNYAPYNFVEKKIVKTDNLFLGEDVFIVGFPSAIGLKKLPQFDYEKPLLKRGAIASISDNFNNFIIDCPVYGGNSGGPVFLERKSFEKYSLRLIGIVTEYIPFYKETASKKDSTIQTSSYAVIVPIEYAFNLLNKNKLNLAKKRK